MDYYQERSHNVSLQHSLGFHCQDVYFNRKTTFYLKLTQMTVHLKLSNMGYFNMEVPSSCDAMSNQHHNYCFGGIYITDFISSFLGS